MIQTYTIMAVAGFSLAAVFAVAAVALFFALRIREVRDDLTGRTAARSIAEIRSRAKTRKRPAPAAAKGLGWETEMSTDDLADFASAGAEEGRAERTGRTAKKDWPGRAAKGERAVPDGGRGGVPWDEGCEDAPSEQATSLLAAEAAADKPCGADGAEAPTSLLGGAAPTASGKPAASDEAASPDALDAPDASAAPGKPAAPDAPIAPDEAATTMLAAEQATTMLAAEEAPGTGGAR